MWVSKTIAFSGTCEARAEVVLCSKRIMRPFRLVGIHVHFPTGCQNLLKVSVWIGSDAETPSSGYPAGVNVFEDYGQVGYVRGDGQSKVLSHVVEQREAGAYVKVHADNEDYYPHDVDVEVEIEVDA